MTSLNRSMVGFGAVMDTNTFSYCQFIADVEIDIDSERKEVIVRKGPDELRLAEKGLDSYFVIDRSGWFFIPLKKPVCCFRTGTGRYPDQAFTFTDAITSQCLGDTTTLCLCPAERALKLKEFLIDELHLACFYAVLPMVMTHREHATNDQLQPRTNFLANYSWQMVLSLGFHVKHRLTGNFMHQVNRLAHQSNGDSYPDHRFYRKMLAVYFLAKKNRFFDIVKGFSSVKPQWLPEMQASYDYIPRLFLTPYGQYPRPLKPLRGNRVLRQQARFGPTIEHFCRVMLRDCDMSMVKDNLINAWRDSLRAILMDRGLHVGQRQYFFLLFSNSQLRDRSLCFYRQYGQMTVAKIHRWMGEFQHEKSIGTRLARMAQCFTSTMHGIEVGLDANVPSTMIICL